MAYEFWLAVERARVARQLEKADLASRAGVARTTVDKLRTTTRPPSARVVYGLADVIGMDHEEAARLAGLLPPQMDAQISVRDAVTRSAAYTEQQKDALIAMIDALDAANSGPRRADGAAVIDEAI